jgi:hypothetical protein
LIVVQRNPASGWRMGPPRVYYALMQALDNDAQPLALSHCPLQTAPATLIPCYTRLPSSHTPSPFAIPATSQTFSQLLSQTCYYLTHRSRIVADDSLTIYVSTRSRAYQYELQRR